MTSPNCPLATGRSVGAFSRLYSMLFVETGFSLVLSDRCLSEPFSDTEIVKLAELLISITTVYPCANVQGCHGWSGGKFSKKKFMYSLHTSPV